MRMSHLADRLFNRPHLVMEEKLVVIIGALSERFGVDVSGFDRIELNRFAGRQSDKGDYRITKEGIAIVPIIGTLVNPGAYTGASPGLTSYEGIAKQLKDADKDSGVRGILLDMDTPGGEAAGLFELPGMLRDIGKRKPVWAYVNDMAASAGYLIASSASEIWTTRTGILGSIGAVMVHWDHAKRLDNEGIKPTVLRAGKLKAEINPFGPMPAAARERRQAELDMMREMFIHEVVKGRPKLKADNVRATEAGTFMGESAVKISLADGVAGFDRVLELIQVRVGKLPPLPAGFSTKTGTTLAASRPFALNEDAMTEDGARALLEAERGRVKAILGSVEAKGRESVAAYLATETDLAPEAALHVLRITPRVEAAATAARTSQAFYEAVAKSGGNPRVSSEDQGGSVPAKSRFIADSEARFRAGSGARR